MAHRQEDNTNTFTTTHSYIHELSYFIPYRYTWKVPVWLVKTIPRQTNGFQYRSSTALKNVFVSPNYQEFSLEYAIELSTVDTWSPNH